MLQKLEKAPKFDRTRPHGTIYGSGESGLGASVTQDGHYYTSDGTYVGSDPNAKVQSRAPAPTVIERSGEKQVSEAEIPELLEHPQAAQLICLPIDTLRAMIAMAGGPDFYGDHALEMSVAWLIKFTC